MDYLDFDLEIGPGNGPDYSVTVIESPAGEARETMRFPFNDLELENRVQAIQLVLLRSGVKQRRVLPASEQTIQDFGQRLFEAILTGEVRTRYDVSRREAARQGMGLRLKLRIRSPELATVPWEFLYDPRQQEYICFSRHNPVIRYLEAQQPNQPLMVQLPLRILGMVAAPNDLVALDVSQEKARVGRAIERLQALGLVELSWVEGQTWRDLQHALQRGPWHIFHFIGHGGFDPQTEEGFIALATDEGQTHCLNATQLGRLLVDHVALRLVLLNACEGARSSTRDLFSSIAATLIRRGIPAVVAMQFEISDHAAVEFAPAFYTALANGIAVDGAVAEARKAISLALTNTVEWATPVLFLRAADGKIFDVTKAQAGQPLMPSSQPPIAQAPTPAKPAERAAGQARSLTPLSPTSEIPPRASRLAPSAPVATATAQPKIQKVMRRIAVVALLSILALVGFSLWRGQSSLVASTGMVKVDAGQYPIGKDQQQNISAFWIDRYEVTNAQFAAFLARRPAIWGQVAEIFGTAKAQQPVDWVDGEIPAGLGGYPVRGIDWATATQYCEWVGKRLPTEVEWEVAARGPRGWLYPWGNEENQVQLPTGYTYPVGSIPTNRSYFGVFDMTGNVWEWVRDPYSPIDDGQQIMRGGAYDLRYDATFPMIGLTGKSSQLASLFNTGMRCAADGDRVQPTLPDAALALDDDFTLTNTGWPAINENTFIVNYHPPALYHVESRQANAYVAAFYERAAFANFILETDVFVDAMHTDHQSGHFLYGLAVRYSNQQFIAFVISATKKQWQILQGTLAKDTYTGSLSDLRLIAEGEDNAIEGASATGSDRLALTTNGAEFIFTIDGKIVKVLPVAGYHTGQIGFVVITQANVTKVHIHYDWVKVQKIEPFDISLPRDQGKTPQ